MTNFRTHSGMIILRKTEAGYPSGCLSQSDPMPIRRIPSKGVLWIGMSKEEIISLSFTVFQRNPFGIKQNYKHMKY